ncbi:MAG: hypothetical protein WBQ13_02815, partial [Terriglobales bacterium]
EIGRQPEVDAAVSGTTDANFAEAVTGGGKSIFIGRSVTSAAKEFAEKVEFRCPAPEGASDFKRLAVSLKRYPDTKLSFSAICEAVLFQKPIQTAPLPIRQPAAELRSAGQTRASVPTSTL